MAAARPSLLPPDRLAESNWFLTRRFASWKATARDGSRDLVLDELGLADDRGRLGQDGTVPGPMV